MNASRKLAGIVGWPVAHSVSPQLHAYWLREYSVAGAYLSLPVRRENFSLALGGLKAMGFVGINVTVPHKEAAFAIAHECDEAAMAAGAVNLLLLLGGRYVGRNTDVRGLEAALREEFPSNGLSGKAAVVLGAGGAARAAILACDRLNATAVRIVNRHAGRAQSLVAALKDRVHADLAAFSWENFASAADEVALLINATSGGMTGSGSLALDLDRFPPEAAVCDLVYNPLETALLAQARARGHQTIDGLGMLMHQGVPSFEALFGVTPQVTPALRAELEGVLRSGR